METAVKRVRNFTEAPLLRLADPAVQEPILDVLRHQPGLSIKRMGAGKNGRFLVRPLGVFTEGKKVRVFGVQKEAANQFANRVPKMPAGQIVALNPEKGFGFIKPTAQGDDVFFHNSVVNCPIELLRVGQEVEFEVDADAKRARAKSVTARGGQHHDRHLGRSSSDKRRSLRPRNEPAVKTECGYVTKLLLKKGQGFISADAGGAELLFDQSDVFGDKRFQQMKIGDYVRFVRNPSAGPNPIHHPPTAKAVQVIPRVPRKLPYPGAPNNPKARRKKPTWR